MIINKVTRLVYIPLAVIIVMAITGSSPEMPGSVDGRMQALRDSITALREEGRYADAVSLARELVTLVEGDEYARPYERVDAGRLLATLRMAEALPDSDRALLARSERMRDRYEELFDWFNVEAVKVARDIVGIQTKILGSDHHEVAMRICDLARAHQRHAMFDSAAVRYGEALAILERSVGEEHPDIALLIYHTGSLKFEVGALAMADDLFRRALAMQRKLLGEEHTDIANTLNDIGLLHWARGAYPAADSTMRESLAMQRRVHGPEHEAVATTMTNLGLVLISRGRYRDAEPHLLEALAMRRRLLGEEHPMVGNSLNSLGGLFFKLGDYSSSGPFHERALAIRRKVFDATHPTILLNLNNVAADKWKQGDLHGAQENMEEALRVFREKYGKDHPSNALFLNNLAAILMDREKYAEAESLFTEALAIWRKIYISDEHEDIATCLNNVAVTHIQRGNRERARVFFSDALKLYNAMFGDMHHRVTNCLTNIGASLLYEGELERARELLEKASDINHEIFVASHPLLVTTLRLLGAVHICNADYEKAKPVLQEAAIVFENARRRVSTQRFMQAAYTASDSPYPLLAIARLKSEDGYGAWRFVERDRGRALMDMLETRALRRLTAKEIEMEAHLDSVLTGLEGALAAFKAQADEASLVKADSVRTLLLDAESRWLEFEKDLAEKYPITEGQSYSLEKVQASLGPRSAIVGWLDFLKDRFVYVVPPDGPVVWRELSSAAIDSITDIYRADLAAASGDAPRWKELGRIIYDERLAPIESVLELYEQLCIISSGPMIGIPAEALMIDDGTYVSDRWNVSYVPSATVLAWLKERPEPRSAGSFLALADPPFNERHAKEMEQERDDLEISSAVDQAELGRIRNALKRGERAAIHELPRLMGSRHETRSIARLFDDALVFLGGEASEQSVVDLAERDTLSTFRYIHLATHAIPDSRQGERSYLVLSQVDLPDPVEAAIAGERIVDGRLEMEEVLRDWRLDAELVCLSACETALGRRMRGEGYIGFSHALFNAGARCVLVSLWKVDDLATRKLMVRFYENMIERGMPKAAALGEAKHWLRTMEARGGTRPYEHPSFWAGFILSGDPR